MRSTGVNRGWLAVPGASGPGWALAPDHIGRTPILNKGVGIRHRHSPSGPRQDTVRFAPVGQLRDRGWRDGLGTGQGPAPVMFLNRATP